MLLVLAALKHRAAGVRADRQLVPVPVMFTLHGWDPSTQRVGDWLAARLQQTYPLFAGKRGKAEAAELVKAGRVAAFLDGLDEISEDLRPAALRALSQQAVFRVVVLAAEFRDGGRGPAGLPAGCRRAGTAGPSTPPRRRTT